MCVLKFFGKHLESLLSSIYNRKHSIYKGKKGLYKHIQILCTILRIFGRSIIDTLEYIANLAKRNAVRLKWTPNLNGISENRILDISTNKGFIDGYVIDN